MCGHKLTIVIPPYETHFASSAHFISSNHKIGTYLASFSAYAVNMIAVGHVLSKVTQKVRACPVYKEGAHVWMKLLSRILAMHMGKRWSF